MENGKHVTAFGYVLTYLALIVLATVSLLLSFVHWPAGDLVLSLIIAAVKAVLVLWFFMHLYEQRFANRFVILVSFAFVGLLVSLVAIDVASRQTFPSGPSPSASEPYRR